ncbi:hypothetical protein KEM48_003184 [Puccinia striiformis f. sp. tritici PST-130]|nr:hypothetical protein KEM48_003184 [Puccinia striiformis f. sp. tritici PST-130]
MSLSKPPATKTATLSRRTPVPGAAAAGTPKTITRTNTKTNITRLPATQPRTTIANTPQTIKAQSRLPRAAANTPGISNPATKKLRVKKVEKPNAVVLVPSLAITLEPSPSKQISTGTDPDQTPKKKSNLNTSQNDRTAIAFPTTSSIAEQTPKRPMTRARSKQILDRSTTSSTLGISQTSSSNHSSSSTGIPKIKRRPSRVMELAQAFQQQQEAKSLSVTPQRKRPQQSISPKGSSSIGIITIHRI